MPAIRATTVKPKHCVRSYLFKVDGRCNSLKLSKLEAMHAEWQLLLPVVGDHLWANFLAGERPVKSLSSHVGATSIFGTSLLQASIKQCMAVTVEGQLQSWKSNLQLRITRLVMRSDQYAANPELRHQILWLNAMQLWLVPRDQQLALLAAAQGKTKVTHVEPRCSRLMARYLRAYIHRFKPPRFDKLPLQVNQFSSVWAQAQDSKLDGVDFWLRISTLERGARIELPIRANAYAARFAGEQALTFSLFPRDGHWYVKVCKKLPMVAPRAPDGPILGLDTGMTNLVATSQGAIFGQGFGRHLQRWDARLQALTKGLQGAGELKLSRCKRYRRLVGRLRSWMTSEVKAAVNKALVLGEPSTVVIEALSFSSQPGLLSRRMNRLVRRMGTGIVRETLAQKAQLQGFKLVDVNPAYTSQECSACGFISRSNRKGNRFKCVCCGKQAHADAQAARNLVERFRQGRTCTYVKHTAVGTQGLLQWAARMRARLDRQTPGTSGHQGVIGDVRAGLWAMQKGRSKSLVPVESFRSLFSEISGANLQTV